MIFEQLGNPNVCGSVGNPQQVDDLTSNHIQIQMIYPQGTEASCGIRKQIASMSELIECNNKAILNLIEVPPQPIVEEPASRDQPRRDLEGDPRRQAEIKTRHRANVRKIEIFRNDPRAHRSVESNGLPFDKIFGSGSYKYSLILAETLPKILYKERNFNLNVLLIDNASNMVCNSTVDHWRSQSHPYKSLCIHLGCRTPDSHGHKMRKEHVSRHLRDPADTRRRALL